jgi:simple sugar transport system permease protein
VSSEISLHAAEAATVIDAQPDPSPGAPIRSRRVLAVRDALIRSLVPVILALVAGGALLAILGVNPFTFYGNIWQYGVAQGSWQDSAVLAAPLLLIAVGLIVVFRANIWNLGYDGQYLLAAALITGVAPHLGNIPVWLSLLALFALSMAVGAAWTIVPAVLKARYQTNEIITTLMMSFIGIGLANILVKGPFQDPTVNIPQTRVIPPDRMLPAIPGTRIHIGFLIAIGVAVIAYYVLTRSSFGLRLHVFGANPRAAAHVGIDVHRLIVRSFLISGALVGMAAAVDILGLWGYVRANWNPAYGDTVIPFVFLARLNPLAVIPFIFFFAILSTGGDLAAANANVSTDFLLVLVALILLFMTIIEFLGRRRELGGSYLPSGLRSALRQPLWRRRSSQVGAGEAPQ